RGALDSNHLFHRSPPARSKTSATCPSLQNFLLDLALPFGERPASYACLREAPRAFRGFSVRFDASAFLDGTPQQLTALLIELVKVKIGSSQVLFYLV